MSLLALAAITFYTMSHPQQSSQFQAWQEKYGKVYPSDQLAYRMKVWAENQAFVIAHNARYEAGLETFDLELNMFGDLTLEEFTAKHLITFPRKASSDKAIGQTQVCNGSVPSVGSLPDYLNWTQKGAVTSVKNQGSCGSCWAFSSVGSIESTNFIKHNQLMSLSSQQMVDCTKGYGNSGCDGGDMNLTFFYVKDHGITTDKEYPYKAMDNKCAYHEEKQAASISDCVEVPVNSEDAMLRSINVGPVSVAVQGNQLTFQFYKSGVFTGKCGYELNHAILAVGYGSMNDKKSGELKKYYNVKNSWGAGWGMDGYILMERDFSDPRGKCGIHMAASYALA